MIKPGFFRRDVEQFFKLGIAAVALSALLGTFAWGYEQRRQAQTWRDLACTYRLADVGRRATFLAVDEQTPAACNRLSDLGLSVPVPAWPRYRTRASRRVPDRNPDLSASV
jgi:hypothetical protein